MILGQSLHDWITNLFSIRKTEMLRVSDSHQDNCRMFFKTPAHKSDSARMSS